MSKLEKQKEKAKSLEAKDPKGAIEAWRGVLEAQEEEGEPNPDLSIFNRIGDLYLKTKDPGQAADYYDKAVDRYAELGFHNNAIAMCNKVLRNAPARQTTYLKLAKLYAAKGFMAEAKQNFVEYAERMQRVGKIQQAFAALKEFTDISPESAHLRGMLEEHLRMYGDADRPQPPRPTPPASAATADAKDDLTKSGKHKTSNLVFLDLDEPPSSKKPGAQPGTPPVPPPAQSPSRVSSPAPPAPAVAKPVLPEPEPEPLSQSLVESVTAEPDTSLEIESTSLGEGVAPTDLAGTLDGLETTGVDFGSIQLSADELDVPSLRDELTADQVGPLPELEPTIPPEADSVEVEPADLLELEPLLEDEIEIARPGRPAPAAPSSR